MLGQFLFILHTKPFSDLTQCQSFAYDKSASQNIPQNIQYLLWKPVSQTSRPGCWKINWNWGIIKQKLSSSALLPNPNPFQSLNPQPSPFSSSAKNLGFYITDEISIKLHIKNVCQLTYSELCHISSIHHLLSVNSTKTLVSAFALSRFDYCNSLHAGIKQENYHKKLQKVPNSTTRLVQRS